MTHLYAHYLLVTCPPLIILTWLLESQWLCTNTGVIALSFYRPLAPFVLLTHAQLAVVTQSCTLLYIAVHCDLLLQWRYCSCNAYCSRYLIVLLQYISQACWVLRSDFTHTQIHWTASLLFSLSPTEAHVRYDLVCRLCTIWSRLPFDYDTISGFSLVRYQSQSHTYYDT